MNAKTYVSMSTFFCPPLEEEPCRHLGLAVTGEHALEVHAHRAVRRLAGLEIGEVPDMHAGDPRPPVGKIEIGLDDSCLILLGPHLRRLAVGAGNRVGAELRDDDRLAGRGVQGVELAY